MMRTNIIFILILIFLNSCKGQLSEKENNNATEVFKKEIAKTPKVDNTEFDSETNTIHIIVALCDNKYQGIIPVPKSIGNGQDSKNNLYWGTAYGIKTYFKRSSE